MFCSSESWELAIDGCSGLRRASSPTLSPLLPDFQISYSILDRVAVNGHTSLAAIMASHTLGKRSGEGRGDEVLAAESFSKGSGSSSCLASLVSG